MIGLIQIVLIIWCIQLMACKVISEGQKQSDTNKFFKDISDELEDIDKKFKDFKLKMKNGDTVTTINNIDQDEDAVKHVNNVGPPSTNENAFEEILEKNLEAGNVDLIEGDIKVIPGDPRNSKSVNSKRNVIREKAYLWQTKVVPYTIVPKLEYGRSIIEEALNVISSNSCITFVVRSSEESWIRFVQKTGCYSSIGKVFWTNGAQDISLGAGCMYKGIVIHEVLHALGFYHEQSRSDRDKFIEIFWENIPTNRWNNFEKGNSNTIDQQEVDYDYDSIMHYGKSSFGKVSGQKTIAVIGKPEQNIGQRDGLSAKDIIELNLLYDCKNTAKSFVTSWSSYGPCDKSSCKKYRQRFCTHADKTKCPGVDYWGVEKEEQICSQEECHAPIDGHWGRWSVWSTCSVTCDNGTKSRNRKCDDPGPTDGGKSCIGENTSIGLCQSRSCSLGPFDCQFQYGFCDWTTNINDRYRWYRRRASTPSQSTGPGNDHTLGNAQGYYVFTESSLPAAEGDVAPLLSVKFNSTSHRCLTFWYHMYGLGIGTLGVDIVRSGRQNEQLWTMSGNKGNAWKYAEIDFSSDIEYQVAFNATRGASYTSDFALDDIYFKDRKCSLSVKKIGCFTHFKFPSMENMRSSIDWYNMTLTVNKCSDHVRDLGYTYFALEFYGECWFGPSINFDEVGKSDKCYAGLVGEQKAMMVYEFV